MLAYLMKVDFELLEAVQIYDLAWWQRVERGEITQDELRRLADTQWGVVKELQIKLRANK